MNRTLIIKETITVLIMIRTNHLQKVFRTEEVETYALNDVSIDVREGEFVAIMGPSGCGKSTLLNILGLLDNPTAGEYFLNDTEVSKFTETRRTDLRKGVIGFVFQSFNLIDELNVHENIELPLLYMKISATERKRRVEAAMERMGITHRAKHFPQQLSGGQQQRVAIARAVVASPKLILADEPTGNLDSKNGKEVMELLSELNKEGATIVMVTHSQHDAGYASRVINLFDGQVVTEVSVSAAGGCAISSTPSAGKKPGLFSPFSKSDYKSSGFFLHSRNLITKARAFFSIPEI
jgi:putative ABC transport system ATP-binding protein